MSRKNSRTGPFFSPVQRKACVVLICCALAIVASLAVAWLLPGKLDALFTGSSYDPDLYPVDTTLGSVLPASADAGNEYITTSVFVGDQYAASLQSASQITLNQFAGADGMKVSEFTGRSCVNFVNDMQTYTIPQAMAKMKPRRVIVMLGANDVDGSMAADSFLMGYRQVLSSITAGYPYCDVIVNAIPPVLKSSENAAARQQTIDQFNQSLAALCNELGFKFLNSSEVLKNRDGYAESSYFDSSTGLFSKTGVNTMLSYVSTHAWQTGDQRPDTSDIPQRAASAANEPAATPTPTPKMHKVIYTVEDGKGTLNGNGQTGAYNLEFEAADGDTVTVTAVAAEGFTFYKWSDNQSSATRVDTVTQDMSVKALFNDARVGLTLSPGDNATMRVGESRTITAAVTLGDSPYENSNVQWAVNDDIMSNGGTYTFTATEAGMYKIKAGISIGIKSGGEVVEVYQSAELTITVEAEPTSISISGAPSVTAGNAVTLSADVKNGSGETTWSCDQTSWTATGGQVQFTANEPGTYTLRAKNNGAEAAFQLNVEPRQEPAPPSGDEPQE